MIIQVLLQSSKAAQVTEIRRAQEQVRRAAVMLIDLK